jgi:hypothetical protein
LGGDYRLMIPQYEIKAHIATVELSRAALIDPIGCE